MNFFCSWYDDDECDDNNVQRNPWKGLLACNNRYCCLLARLCLAWRPRCDTSHGHKEPCEASRGQGGHWPLQTRICTALKIHRVTWPALILWSIIGKNGAAYRQHFPRTDTIVNKTKSPNYSQYSPRVLSSPRVWQLSHDLCSGVLCLALMASLADLVTSWAGLEIFSWPSCVTIERRQVWCRGVRETDLDVPWAHDVLSCLLLWCTPCNIIILMSSSCVNRSQWTLWWILSFAR